MSTLAGATAADAVTSAGDLTKLRAYAGVKHPRAVDPATQDASAITQFIDGYEITSSTSGPPAPSLPTNPVSLTTPELIKLRALGKSKATYMRAGEKKDFNLERDAVVDRLTQAVGFDGVLDTCCVTPNLKGVPDPNQCTKVELTKSLRRVLDGQWEEVGRTNNPLNSYVDSFFSYYALV